MKATFVTLKLELESDIEPFKGLLLGLFFITVGASIDFGMLFENFGTVIVLTIGVMGLKAGVLFGLSKLFKMRGSNRWLFTLGLAQAGEFAFVLLAFTVASHAITKELADLLLLVVALSMLLTPALFIVHERFLSRKDAEGERDADSIDEKESILIAGHGRFGGVVNRILRGLGYNTTVVDYNYERLEIIKKFGFRVYYGDATRPDLLHAAGIEKAKIFVIAIDGREKVTELVKYCTQNYPHVHVIARASDRHHVYDLWAAGCRDIIRENFDSAVRTGRCALEALGLHPFDAERKARNFVKVDQHMIRKLAYVYKPDIPVHENEEYIKKAKEVREETEHMFKGTDRFYGSRSDRGWAPPTLKDVSTVINEANG